MGAEAGEGISEGVQLKFFDDSRPNVLGIESQNVISGSEKSFFSSFIEWIEKFDSRIISNPFQNSNS